MDDTLCQDFFRQPTQMLHRRYEALRAFFVERRPVAEIAQAFGYTYGTFRNLIADFRAQCRARQTPPFSPNHPAVDHLAAVPVTNRLSRTHPPLPIAAVCR